VLNAAVDAVRKLGASEEEIGAARLRSIASEMSEHFGESWIAKGEPSAEEQPKVAAEAITKAQPAASAEKAAVEQAQKAPPREGRGFSAWLAGTWLGRFGLWIGRKVKIQWMLIMPMSGQPKKRIAAVRYLAKYGVKREKILKIITKYMGDPDLDVAAAVMEVLSKPENKEAVPFLIGALADKDHMVRLRAVASLGALGAKEAIRSLLGCLADENEKVRAIAYRVLTASLNAPDEFLVPKLVSLTKHRDAGIRKDAIKFLGKRASVLGKDSSDVQKAINDLSVRCYNRKLSGDEYNTVVEAFHVLPITRDQLVSAMLAAIGSSDENVCVAALNVLGDYGTSFKARDAIVQIIQKEEPSSRKHQAAQVALSKITARETGRADDHDIFDQGENGSTTLHSFDLFAMGTMLAALSSVHWTILSFIVISILGGLVTYFILAWKKAFVRDAPDKYAAAKPERPEVRFMGTESQTIKAFRAKARRAKDTATTLMSVYWETGSIADSHGNVARVKQLVKALVKRGAKRIVLLGDYIDRDVRSRELLEYVKWLMDGTAPELEGNKIEIVPLMGNHELMFIYAMLGNHLAFDWWVDNGGDKTLERFGITREMVFRELMAEGEVPSGQETKKRMYEKALKNTELRELANWMRMNFRLSYLDERKVLYLHAGINVNDRGLPDLRYGNKHNLEALEKMQEDLRSAEKKEDIKKIFSELSDDSSPLFLREVLYGEGLVPWYEYIARKGTADEFCRKLGVSAIVVGHDPQEGEAVNVGNRIFVTDILMQKQYFQDVKRDHDTGTRPLNAAELEATLAASERGRGGFLLIGIQGIVAGVVKFAVELSREHRMSRPRGKEDKDVVGTSLLVSRKQLNTFVAECLQLRRKKDAQKQTRARRKAAKKNEKKKGRSGLKGGRALGILLFLTFISKSAFGFEPEGLFNNAIIYSPEAAAVFALSAAVIFVIGMYAAAFVVTGGLALIGLTIGGIGKGASILSGTLPEETLEPAHAPPMAVLPARDKLPEARPEVTVEEPGEMVLEAELQENISPLDGIITRILPDLV
ncbi:MAG: HEAT repeat domain-containing protein, partial [Candidatus Omnitrophota bacterium]